MAGIRVRWPLCVPTCRIDVDGRVFARAICSNSAKPAIYMRANRIYIRVAGVHAANCARVHLHNNHVRKSPSVITGRPCVLVFPGDFHLVRNVDLFFSVLLDFQILNDHGKFLKSWQKSSFLIHRVKPLFERGWPREIDRSWTSIHLKHDRVTRK